MIRKFGAAAAAAVLIAGVPADAGAEEQPITYKPLSIAAMAEAGQFYGARFGGSRVLDQEWNDHFGVFVTQSADVGHDLSFNIGLGGIFHFMKREVTKEDWGGTQLKFFGIGPTVADLRYGSLHAGEGLGLQFGRFAYKYNPDATNLGEYLFRSGAYPTFVLGGGYAYIGAPEAHLQGLRLNYTAGDLSADLLVVTENTMAALYDFSVAGLVSYKVADGLLDIGGGVNFKRLIPVRPSKTSKPVADNAFFTKDGKKYVGNPKFYSEQAAFWTRRATEDPTNAAAHTALAAQFSETARLVGTDNKAAVDGAGNPLPPGWRDSTTQKIAGSEYYSMQAVILMARASVDFKKMISSEAFGPNDLRLSVEANLLGVKNYSIYYENHMDRLPITASFNLPAFRLLDLLSLQVEYFNSPWQNSFESIIAQNLAIPSFQSGSDKDVNQSEWNDITKRDNLSWSLLLRKNMGGAAWIAAQFARDHSRALSSEFWSGPGLTPTEILQTEKDWYWMVQLGFGI